MTSGTVRTGVTNVTAVRAQIRAYRRGNIRPRTWSDRYTLLVGLAVAVAVLSQPVMSVLGALAGQADPARVVPGLVLLGLALAGALAAARAVGPVAVSAADAAWLLLSPLPRRAVLSRTGAILLAVALAAGAVLGLGLLGLLGAEGSIVVSVAVATVLGVSATAGGGVLTVLAQADPAWERWWIPLAVALAVLVALAAVFVPVAGGAGTAVAAALLVRRAWTALASMPAAAVLTASTRAGHVATATVGLDPGVLTWIAEENHWRTRVLRSRPWPKLPAPLALAWYDWRRLARRPLRMALLAGSVALPALAVAARGDTDLTPVLLLAGALAAAVAGTAGARRDGEDPTLARLLGVGQGALLAARGLLPAFLAAVWLAAALMTLDSSVSTIALAPLAAPAIAAGALRMARRRPVDHSMPIIDTPGGAIPTGPLIWAFTGIDIALLGCAPLLLAFSLPAGAAGGLPAVQAVMGAGTFALYTWRAARRAPVS
ncbi:DUF6297 family protein [Spongiactinospora sp. TRM90649]|uniref:DUF6297 family protein n=1 Tax=Spongiactinospora sp. TRM90649 TaxID=3031114 RepID=UPI0023F91030|nr:DUF6297 family protein [Spongiactinospora sp. TRM90649]MDF5751221.1 DUF6297 family protein [Spongiactinospora sp. TRM90649]